MTFFGRCGVYVKFGEFWQAFFQAVKNVIIWDEKVVIWKTLGTSQGICWTFAITPLMKSTIHMKLITVFLRKDMIIDMISDITVLIYGLSEIAVLIVIPGTS